MSSQKCTRCGNAIVEEKKKKNCSFKPTNLYAKRHHHQFLPTNRTSVQTLEKNTNTHQNAQNKIHFMTRHLSISTAFTRGLGQVDVV